MAHLTIEHFTAGATDPEAAYYRILMGLRTIHAEFVHNRLYPPLAELLELHATLVAVRTNGRTVDGGRSRRIVGIDLENGTLQYAQDPRSDGAATLLLELIDAVMPAIATTINEGRTIYNFIDEHLQLEEVGILPTYTAEGYAFVPDPAAGELHVYRYATSVTVREGERYHNLRTNLVRTVPWEPFRSTASLKLDLIAADPSMPNPATWSFTTDIDFPYREAMLPIARRQLMQRVAAGR